MKKDFNVVFMARKTMMDKVPKEYYAEGFVCPEEIFPGYWIGKIKNRIAFMLKWRIAQYRFIKQIIKEGEQFDKIFFSSVDIFSFSIATRSSQIKSNLLFVDHGIFHLKEKTTRFAYRYFLASQINIIALEEYIRDYLFENHIKNRIKVVHHPVPKMKANYFCSPMSDKQISIFAPSTSNDEQFISYLLEKVNRIPKNVKIFIKSKRQQYRSSNLIIFNERINTSDYNHIFDEADFILIPYEDNYNYRTSAILFEALNLEKKVLLRNNNTLRHYFDNFKKAVGTFNTVDELIVLLSNLATLEFDKVAIQNFMDRYQDNYIGNQIYKAFNIQ
jgi:hypothetical protein